MYSDKVTMIYPNATFYVNVVAASNFSLAYRNECLSIDVAFPDLVDKAIVRLCFGLLYASVWILGLTGNAIILYLIFSPNSNILFTVRTVFIGSLACSDLAIGIMSLPVTAVTIFTRAWPFAAYMCHAVGFFQAGSIFISSFTLTFIAVDRFQLILHPTANVITYTRARIIIALIWVVGYCLASPQAKFVHVIQYVNTCGRFCEESWPTEHSRQIYGLIVLCLQFGLPVLISGYCYVRISRRLADQVRRRRNQAILPEAERRLTARRRRTNRMMASMVGLFAAAWLPLNAINLVRDFKWHDALVPAHAYNVLFALCHLVSMTSLVWNPVVYGLYNEAFRKAVVDIVRTTFGGRWSHRYGRTSTTTKYDDS